ncbi:hypothetical protein [Bombilactobacillus thymidiniphilus]|uniref:Transposase n=1 Tax=Bombilactobacillus thymidiniphilus TaxID=2923363 RepID=A0ABY4PD05_9LACO|nr:hypothetical protein [Bombilactobacillus thymidiniphilus]UQS83582.1 hypothetical protein MOO47_07400 [Bombilactobacillus thymidiniphilus]
MYKPRKLAALQLSPTALKVLTAWLIEAANRKQIVEQTDLTKSSLFRYIKQIKSGEKQISELFTFQQMQQLIALQNSEWNNYKKVKEDPANTDLSKQEKQVAHTLKKRGWSLSQNNLDFAKVLRLQAGNQTEQTKGNELLASWTSAKRAHYQEYKKQVTGNE